jgi:uncharacterized protein (DUF1697 family)
MPLRSSGSRQRARSRFGGPAAPVCLTMPTFISMVRGINVGGARPLKMETLRGLHAGLGHLNVRSYLQSGNVVFESDGADAGTHAADIERAIKRESGHDVSVGVWTARALSATLARNPLSARGSLDPTWFYAVFLIRPMGKLTLSGLNLPLAPGEEAILAGGVVYLYCPNGYGETKINNNYFERVLAARATTRNWRTVSELERMGRGEAPQP